MRKIYFFILATMIALNAFGYEKQTWNYETGKKMSGSSQYPNCLDIYYPETGEAPYPVLIYIGAEAWVNSNYKGIAYQQASAFLEYALQRGYAVVCPNNRECGSNDVYFPAPIQDYRAVVRFLHNNGEGLSECPRDLDTSFIAFSGYSSLGSFSAILMSMTRNMNEYNDWDFEGTVGNFLDKSSSVDAVADFGCLSAQTSAEYYPHLFDSRVFGCDLCYSWAQICYQVLVPKTLSNNWAPTIMVYGDNNPILSKQNVTAMYNNLKDLQLGDDCELHIHNKGLSFPTDNATYEAVMNFLDRIRGKKQAQAIESPSLQGRSGEASKFIQDGQLLILRGDKLFNAIGTQVR